MNIEEIKQFIQGGEWLSVAPELRPSITQSASGGMQPFYLSRSFKYAAGDKFEGTVINFADSNGQVPLVKIVIKGHIRFGDAHPLADGAFNLDYIADEAYEITPLHPGFVQAVNKFPAKDLNSWEINVTQDVKGKEFPLFGLSAGESYVDYDLIYISDGLLFNGSKNVDGRAFDKPENRPTNLQIPLFRR